MTCTKNKCHIQTSNLMNKTKVIIEEQRLFSLWYILAIEILSINNGRFLSVENVVEDIIMLVFGDHVTNLVLFMIT